MVHRLVAGRERVLRGALLGGAQAARVEACGSDSMRRARDGRHCHQHEPIRGQEPGCYIPRRPQCDRTGVLWAGFVAKESPRFLKTGASAALICAFVAQFYLYKAYGEAINIFMQTAQYSSVWLPFMTSAAGIFFVFTLAGILARSASASDWLVIVGDRSLHILAGHFAVFQLINIALMSANHVDIGLLSKLTWYTYRPDLYWPVYVIAGVGIPCVASQCWHRVTRPVSDLR
jgi:hypothetical protein